MTELDHIAAQRNFDKFFLSQSLKSTSTLANIPVENEVVYQNGNVGTFIAGAVGGTVGFFLGGFNGAVIGASLAMSLFNGVTAKTPKKEKPRLPTYSFNTAGADELAKQGDTIPIVYCNATVNPNGGVRWTGKLVACKVVNTGDSGYLYQVYAISLGKIGGLDNNKLLIDRQKPERFYPEDLNIELLNGLPSIYNNGGQSGFENPEFNFLGQCISPGSYNLIGVNLRALSKSAAAASSDDVLGGWTSINSFVSGSTVTKNSGDDGVGDAVAYTSDLIGEGGGSFSWKLTSSSTNQVGFGEPGGTTLVYSFRSYITGGLEIWVGNTAYITDGNNTPMTWAVNDILRVDLTFNEDGNKIVNFVKNNITVRSFLTNWTLMPAKVVLSHLNKGILIESTSGLYFSTGDYGVESTAQGENMTVIVYEDEKNSIENYSTFSPAELYEAEGQEFRILEKNPTGRTLLATPYIAMGNETNIYCKWTGYFQNTRKINEVTFNFSGNFYSRPKPPAKRSGKK